jgi:hypothetical protein
MSYLLFIDESGHDHKNTPYEVRGGVAIHASDLWAFIQAFQNLEEACFGTQLSAFNVELKGSRLLERKRFKHACQGEILDDLARRKHALGFLHHGQNGTAPSEIEFRAFGQACMEMARGIFRLLEGHEARVFAAVVPRTTKKPKTTKAAEYLRKDQVFLLQRYFTFVHAKKETGLLVFDETDDSADLHFIRQIERYFTRTSTGRFRATAIVPVPLFVNSDLTRAIQAADVCIYALNWGFRVPKGMEAEVRPEIQTEFSDWIYKLQAYGKDSTDSGVHSWYGIVYVPEPFGVAP